MSKEIAVIVGGGPGVSASCARLFSKEDMTVVVAARNPDKPVLKTLAEEYGVITHACDASDSDSVTALFGRVKTEHGTPNLVVHNIDGRMREIFRKRITEAEPEVLHPNCAQLHGERVFGRTTGRHRHVGKPSAREWSRHHYFYQRQRS